MPAALRLRSPSSLQWALIASIGVHAALLSLRFAAPETFNRLFDNAPLDVVLVNQRTADAPAKPQAVAQANLDAGGKADKGLATTPLPYTADVSLGDAAVNQQRTLSALERKQQQLLTQVRQQIVQLAQTVRQENDPQTRQALEQKRRQLLDMLGAIERQIQQQNARPRRRYIGPSTRVAAYALYYDRLRTKIETLGTREFPQSGGQKLYGSLIMSITIAANGRLVSTEIVQSSGNPTLDRQARAIVEAAQPYGRFTDAMLRQADQIVVISRFRFTRTQGLETAVQAPQSPAQATP
ncbi:MAG: TonB family protein [Thiomonas sp.]|uniref:TonB family protein n=1 Tax=Thiomonas sp. TaxID=2047785 RepID=UPI002A3655BA|nr:TonB family protein [Thiomonas sp.]MDY0330856.1 TonB family protein [Thiomonas sp.]